MAEPTAKPAPSLAPGAQKTAKPLHLQEQFPALAGDCESWLRQGPEQAAVHCATVAARQNSDSGRQQAAQALENTGQFSRAGMIWRAMSGSALGELGKAVTRRANAMAEAELGLVALASGRAADAVKKFRSVTVDAAAQTAAGITHSAGLWLALALAEQAARHGPEAVAALRKVLELGGIQQKSRAAWLLQHPQALWPILERQMGDTDDEAPIGTAPLPGGNWVIAADVYAQSHGSHKLRLWYTDPSGFTRQSITWGSGGDDRPQALAVTKEGIVAIAGASTLNDKTSGWLVTFDRPGNPLRDQRGACSRLPVLIALPDGSLFVAGQSDDLQGNSTLCYGHTGAGAALVAHTEPEPWQARVGVAAMSKKGGVILGEIGATAVPSVRATLRDNQGQRLWQVPLPLTEPLAVTSISQGVLFASANARGLDVVVVSAAGKAKPLQHLNLVQAQTPVWLTSAGKSTLFASSNANGQFGWTAVTAAGKPGPWHELPNLPGESLIAAVQTKPGAVLLSSLRPMPGNPANSQENPRDAMWRRIKVP